MKTERLLFLMVSCACLLQSASFARQSNPAEHQTLSQNGEKTAGDHQKGAAVRGEKDRTRSGEAGDSQERSTGLRRTATKHPPSATHSKPAPSHQLRPGKTRTTNGPRTDAPGIIRGLQQTRPKASTTVPNKVVNHRSVPVPPPTVAVNGQQFRNSRDLGAHLAVSGGPLTATRGTATINGTNMKRKP